MSTPLGFSSPVLDGTVSGATAILTLKRPERLNALSRQLIEDLASAFRSLELDDNIRAIVLTGAARKDGRPCFCAGGDLHEMASGGAAAIGEREYDLVREVSGLVSGDYFGRFGIRRLLESLDEFPKIVIAAIDGICTAGGLELALSCDMRIVATGAEISDLHLADLGHSGGAAGTSRLSRLVGPSKAKELILLGRAIDGAEAVHIGLANLMVSSDALVQTAVSVGNEIATRNPLAVRIIKALANASPDLSRSDALRYDYLCWSTQMAFTGGFSGAEKFRARRA